MKKVVIFLIVFLLIESNICYLGNIYFAADDDVPRVYISIN